MAVDNTLRYRGFNSYELAPNETLYSSLSDCEYLGFVTTQWVALKVGGTIAGGDVRITWIDDTGGQFGSAELYEFTPTRLWERYTWTVAVPPEAVKLRIQFGGGAQGYHFACPMTEPGEIASSFDPNLASAVAYITSEGAYVGFLNAEQITAGLLRAVNGGAWFDLDKPEIVMEGTQADLSITPENPLKLTDKSGKFIGGLGVAGGILGLVAGAMTNDPNMNTYATIGYPDEGGSGISIYDKNLPDVYMGRFGTAFGISLDHHDRLWIDGNGTYLLDENGGYRLVIDGNGTYLYDENDVARLVMSDGTFLFDENGAFQLLMDEDGTFLFDENGVARLWIDPSGNTFLQNAANSHAIGVDNSGPYFIKSGAKSYLDTLVDFSSSLTPISGVTGVRAYKTGRMHFLSFTYKPTKTGFTTNVITGIPSAYLPGVPFAGSVAKDSAADANRDIAALMTSVGSVYVSTTALPGNVMYFTFTWIA